MAVEFWLSKDADRFRFPVNPPSLSVSTSYTHKDLKVIALGDISFPQGSDLARYSFSSIFPEIYNPTFCEYTDLPAPFDCVDKIKGWMDAGEPVRLTITGSPVNTLVTIRGFTYTPWGKGDNDITFSLNLNEYRTPTVARRIIESAPSTTTTTDPVKYTTGTVNVGTGKTLTVRKTASTTASSVGKIKHGATVTILATASGWYKIKSGSITGYVQTKYIKLPGEITQKTTKAVIKKTRPVVATPSKVSTTPIVRKPSAASRITK